MVKSKWRGNDIYFDGDTWRYSKDDVMVRNNVNISCGYCGKEPTEDGHDGCIGELMGLMNACCGHGETEDAYVQFLDKTCVRGIDAVIIMDILKDWSNAGENKEEWLKELF